MSNTTTKARREQWIARAAELIKIEPEPFNGPEVVEALQAELGISRDSARTATAHAIRRKRHEMTSNAAAALGRIGGQSTSAAKQAASRANGRRGGRPKKSQGEKQS